MAGRLFPLDMYQYDDESERCREGDDMLLSFSGIESGGTEAHNQWPTTANLIELKQIHRFLFLSNIRSIYELYEL